MENSKWNDTESDIRLLSHNDLDGHGSEIVLKGLGFKPYVKNLGNHEVDAYIEGYATDILEGTQKAPDILVITDIAPSESVAELLEKLHKQNICEVYLFDHHKTALGLNEYKWAKVVVEEDGIKQCGTSLLYNHLLYLTQDVDFESVHVLSTLVEEIRLYDTWDWESLDHQSAKKLNDALYIIGPKNFIQARLSKIKNGDTKIFSPTEDKLLEVEARRISSYLERKNKAMIVVEDFFVDDEGNTLVAGVVQADSHISELGHDLCNKNPEIDFAVMLQLTENKVSLRAVKDEVDLTPIVTKYGGGGHSHAAGCSLTGIGFDFLQKVYNKLLIKEYNNL